MTAEIFFKFWPLLEGVIVLPGASSEMLISGHGNRLNHVLDINLWFEIRRLRCRNWGKSEQMSFFVRPNPYGQGQSQTNKLCFLSIQLKPLRFLRAHSTLWQRQFTIWTDQNQWSAGSLGFSTWNYHGSRKKILTVKRAETWRGDRRHRLWSYTRSMCMWCLIKKRWVFFKHSQLKWIRAPPKCRFSKNSVLNLQTAHEPSLRPGFLSLSLSYMERKLDSPLTKSLMTKWSMSGVLLSPMHNVGIYTLGNWKNLHNGKEWKKKTLDGKKQTC